MSLLDPLTRTRPRTRAVASIAHRGASGDAPENTLAAIRAAVALGVDRVEVDVRRTRDGALVLLHDPSLSRTTDVRWVFPRREPWPVAAFTYDELCRLDAGAWMGPQHAGARVPLLEEALAATAGTGTGLLVELKTPGRYPGIVAEVAAAVRTPAGPSARRDPVVVQSRDVAAMKEHRTRAPEVPVGLLGAPPALNLRALGTWADQLNPPHRSVDRDYVRAVHDAGMDCHVWTVNREPAMRRARRLGVDGIITNHPAVLHRLLGRG